MFSVFKFKRFLDAGTSVAIHKQRRAATRAQLATNSLVSRQQSNRVKTHKPFYPVLTRCLP